MPAAKIDWLCDLFERRLKEGEHPLLETLLVQVDEHDREELLKELLRIDLYWRHRQGELPCEAEYALRFPEAAEVIHGVFGEHHASAFPEWRSWGALDDRYELRRVLGRGRFGVVFLAWERPLDRLVAIKFPYWHNSESIATFKQIASLESQAASQFAHPHAVSIYYTGRMQISADQREIPYQVYQFVDGENLETYLKRKRPDVPHIVTIITSLAEALHAAHERGIVHRDVKPANILIEHQSGRAILTDFGLATRTRSASAVGVLAGTPCYMSPEQAAGEGHRIDGGSDQYSLGLIFYELLTGRRAFLGLQQARNAELSRPREWDSTIPEALERICLKMLCRERSGRFSSCGDVASALRSYRETVQSDSGPTQPTRCGIRPRGLGCFQAADADYYPELLPGPRGQSGLPESIEFWHRVLETASARRRAPVALLYGPSGCGKSSFLRAGLLPRLSTSLTVLLVECSSAFTERDLLIQLRERCALPRESSASLVETMRYLSQQNSRSAVVLILDQFEQWLQHRPMDEACELTQGLRFCNGVQLQAVLVVREDFWVSISRFAATLELVFEDGRNAAMLDLFSEEHARQVLRRLGTDWDRFVGMEIGSREAFLQEAVAGLSVSGRVVPIQLALLATMLVDRPWTLDELTRIGGAKGVGLHFLQRHLSPRADRANQRHLSAAAIAVLECMLPTTGSLLRGSRRAEETLMRVSGYQHEPMLFEALLRLLADQLQLITPCDPEALALEAPVSVRSNACHATGQSDFSASSPASRSWQLTHDYLVPLLRDWLSLTRRNTASGRARILLQERSQMWIETQDSRELPQLIEWLRIWFFVPHQTWTPSQHVMLRKTAHKLLLRGLVIFISIMILVGWQAVRYQRSLREAVQQEAIRISEGLSSARATNLTSWTPPLRALGSEVRPLLLHAFERALEDSPEQLNLAVGLEIIGMDAAKVRPFLRHRLLQIPPEQLHPILQTMPVNQQAWSNYLQTVLRASETSSRQRLNATCLLTSAERLSHLPKQASPTTVSKPDWLHADLIRLLAKELPELTPTDLVACRDMLRPLGPWLIPGLLAEFERLEGQGMQQTQVAFLLSEYAATDTAVLGQALLSADDRSRTILMPLFARFRQQAIELMEEIMQQRPPRYWGDYSEQQPPTIPPAALLRAISAHHGLVEKDFVLIPCLPFDKFKEYAGQLGASGYRPVRVRPVIHDRATTSPDGPPQSVSALWLRQPGRWLVETGRHSEDFPSGYTIAEKDGLTLRELTAVSCDSRGRLVYAAIWHESEEVSRCALDLSADECQARLEQAAQQDWPTVPCLTVFPDANGTARFAFVVTRGGPPSECHLAWDQQPRVDWPQGDLSAVSTGSSDAMRWIGVWDNQAQRESMQICLPTTLLCSRLQELARDSWRPVSLATITEQHQLNSTVVLQRPIVSLPDRNTYAKRVARAATTLLKLQASHPVLPWLETGLSPDVQTRIQQELISFDVEPEFLRRLLDEDTPTSAYHRVESRRFLLLALGMYAAAGKLSSEQRAWLTQFARKGYEDEPDPGIHSACEWTLKQLDGLALLEEANRRLAIGQPSPRAGWYLTHPLPIGTASAQPPQQVPGAKQIENAQPNQAGTAPTLSLAILRGPHTFLMGSPISEEERSQGPTGTHERRHHRRIPYSFAIGMHEVTIAQWQTFRNNWKPDTWVARTTDAPATGLTWYECAEFCNWLSQQQGIPPDQWCYPPDRPFTDGMQLLPDAIERTGYRLPTEAEWEIACRAGTTTTRFFGDSPAFMPAYAVFSNPLEHDLLAPVGSKLPNAWGLFDVLGNACEWCQERSYTLSPWCGVVDQPEQPVIVRSDEPWGRVVRGGSFYLSPPLLRSADRLSNRPDYQLNSHGFRIARTLPDSFLAAAGSTHPPTLPNQKIRQKEMCVRDKLATSQNEPSR